MSRIQSWLAAFTLGALFAWDWGPVENVRSLWQLLLVLLFLMPRVLLTRGWLRRATPALVALIVGALWGSIPHESPLPDLAPPVPARIDGRVVGTGRLKSKFPGRPVFWLRLEDVTLYPLGGQAGAGIAATGPVFLLQPWSGETPLPAPGQHVRVEAMLQASRGRWTARSAAPDNLRVMDASSLSDRLGRSRGRLRNRLSRFGNRETGATLAALLLGFRDNDRDRREAFRRAGASHFLVVSGLHLGLMAALLLVLTSGRRRTTLILLALYAHLAGGGSPVVRALLAILVLAWARRRGLRVRWGGLLASLAALLLILDPSRVGDAGFRLSFQALGGVLAWAEPLASTRPRDPLEAFLWRKRGPPPARRILQLGLASAGAVLATAPICLTVFGGFAPAAILSGILFPPLVMVLLALGGLTLLIPRAALLAQPVVAAMTDLAQALSHLPGGFLTAPAPPATIAWIHYGLLVLGARWWARDPSWRNLPMSLLPPFLGLVLLLRS